MKRHRTRRPGPYTPASLDALTVQDDGDGTDDPIAALLLQARQRGLPLAVAADVHHAERSPATQPGAVVQKVLSGPGGASQLATPERPAWT
jgi:hypothetical protein